MWAQFQDTVYGGGEGVAAEAEAPAHTAATVRKQTEERPGSACLPPFTKTPDCGMLWLTVRVGPPTSHLR